MNPNLELFDVIYDTLNQSRGTEVAEDLTVEIHQSIRDWMNRNEIIFYQP